MKRLALKYSIPAKLSLLMLASCTMSSPSQMLDQAESALAQGNVDEARSCCVALADSSAHQLTSTQLCRQALLYARLSELCDSPGDMATAAKYFDQALCSDPDSVEAFTYVLSIEDRSSLTLIHTLSRTMMDPADYSDLHEQLDTI